MTTDSARSPIGEETEITRASLSASQTSKGWTKWRKATERITTVAVPEASPSQDFPGLTLGAIGCRPTFRPSR